MQFFALQYVCEFQSVYLKVEMGRKYLYPLSSQLLASEAITASAFYLLCFLTKINVYIYSMFSLMYP